MAGSSGSGDSPPPSIGKPPPHPPHMLKAGPRHHHTSLGCAVPAATAREGPYHTSQGGAQAALQWHAWQPTPQPCSDRANSIIMHSVYLHRIAVILAANTTQQHCHALPCPGPSVPSTAWPCPSPITSHHRQWAPQARGWQMQKPSIHHPIPHTPLHPMQQGGRRRGKPPPMHDLPRPQASTCICKWPMGCCTPCSLEHCRAFSTHRDGQGEQVHLCPPYPRPSPLASRANEVCGCQPPWMAFPCLASHLPSARGLHH